LRNMQLFFGNFSSFIRSEWPHHLIVLFFRFRINDEVKSIPRGEILFYFPFPLVSSIYYIQPFLYYSSAFSQCPHIAPYNWILSDILWNLQYLFIISFDIFLFRNILKYFVN
jgi:hypothetical protein